MKSILSLLPEQYAGTLKKLEQDSLEEIRLGSGRPLRLRYSGREQEIWPVADSAVIEEILSRACHQSVYAYADCIRQGYVTVEGGHRIGVCGYGAGETIRSPSSLNIRIARQVMGCANTLIRELKESTLILGPPGSGKTTLLRDTVRLLSDRRRATVGLVDERGELSASVNGTPQLQVGSRTDVLINIPKATAVMMLLRTMNPSWIALDEITAPADLEAIRQAAYCGVHLLATAHGMERNDLYQRPLYRKLLKSGVFRQVVILRPDKSYSVEEIKP